MQQQEQQQERRQRQTQQARATSAATPGNIMADAAGGDADRDKENAPPGGAARPAPDRAAGLTAALGELTLGPSTESRAHKKPLVEDPEVVRAREDNLRFIGEALEMVRLLRGCPRGPFRGRGGLLVKHPPSPRDLAASFALRGA